MAPRASPWTTAGERVSCPVCRHDQFFDRWLLMNTRGATFLSTDWANREALCLVCARCSNVLWFNTPELVQRAAGETGPSAPPSFP